MRELTIAGAITLFFATSAVSSGWRAYLPRPTTALRPLNIHDMTSSSETAGYSCAFILTGRWTMVHIIGNDFMIRTTAGRQLCRIADDQAARWFYARGDMTCHGVRLSFGPNGGVKYNPHSESTYGPVRLTVTQGRSSGSLAGIWSCI